MNRPRYTLRDLAKAVLCSDDEQAINRMLKEWKKNPHAASRWAQELKVELVEDLR